MSFSVDERLLVLSFWPSVCRRDHLRFVLRRRCFEYDSCTGNVNQRFLVACWGFCFILILFCDFKALLELDLSSLNLVLAFKCGFFLSSRTLLKLAKLILEVVSLDLFRLSEIPFLRDVTSIDHYWLFALFFLVLRVPNLSLIWVFGCPKVISLNCRSFSFLFIKLCKELCLFDQGAHALFLSHPSCLVVSI